MLTSDENLSEKLTKSEWLKAQRILKPPVKIENSYKKRKGRNTWYHFATFIDKKLS